MLIDQFTVISFTGKNLDRYYVRTSIFNALKLKASLFSGQFLDIGCGKMPYKNYLLSNSKITGYKGIDISAAIDYGIEEKPDYLWDGIVMPIEDNSFESIMATEVLEHCPDPSITLKEAYRVLKPQGVFFFTVPFLWPLHEVPHDEYRYTPFALKRFLENEGFKEIEIYALGGWHASMAQMLGLWVNRSQLSLRTRKLLRILLKPLIKYLIKRDKQYKVEFTESSMITGLYGTARK